MRTPFVVGNWKLHKTIAESLALVTALKNQLAAIKGVGMGVAPVFTAIQAVARRLEGSPIATCAQDCHWESRGAWTGEVSADLLADAGASWGVGGHSAPRPRAGVGEPRAKGGAGSSRAPPAGAWQEGARGARRRPGRDRLRR